MTISLRLFLGRVRGVTSLPVLTLSDGTTIPQVFADASDRRAAGGDIQLTLDPSREEASATLPGDPAFSLRLHQALGRLTKNSPTQPRVFRIGMVFADRYAHDESVFGAMFDRGFATADDPFGKDPRYRLPREGCALFLGAIAEHREDPEEYRRQVFYTAVHELGHLFNLGHSSGPDYMVKSPRARTHDADHFAFRGSQQRWLSDCSRSPTVWPGGQRFLGRDPFDGPGDASGLTLSARLTRESMCVWEPVELELRLRLSEEAPQPIPVPREFDPGYPRLQVWIEEPSGERRLLHSPRHYCRREESTLLAPGEAIERDLSIFGESGGYTFRVPGVHRVWATWRQAGGEIASDPCEVEVLGPGSPSPADTALRSREAARLLYYRLGSRRSSRFRELERLAVAVEGPTGASLKYAIGRAHARNREEAKSSSSRRSHATRAREWLERACQDTALGDHARGRGNTILESLS